MILLRLLYGSKGVSLAGVMAGIAVSSALALIVAQIVSNAFSGQKLIEYRENVKNIKYDMIGILSSRQNCTQTFVNINPITNTQPERTRLINSGAEHFQIFNGTTPVFSENTVRVLRYYFRTGANSDFVTVDPVERKGMVSLYVDFQAHNPRLGGATTISHAIKLSVDLDPSNLIESCIAAGNDEDSLWKLAGTIGIFYTASPGPTRVGVGTNGPIEALDLHGFLKVDQPSPVAPGGTLSAGALLTAPLISAGTIQSATFRSEQFLNNSDYFLKSEVRPLKDWQRVLGLKGVQFSWKNKPDQIAFGFIAQDIQKILPMMVYKDHGSSILRIEELQLIAPIIEGIKSISRDQKDIEARIRALQEPQTTQPQLQQ